MAARVGFGQSRRLWRACKKSCVTRANRLPPLPMQARNTGPTAGPFPSSHAAAVAASSESESTADDAAAAAVDQVASSAIFLARHHGIMASLPVAKHGQSRNDVTRCVRPGVTAIMKGIAGSKVGWGNERGGWTESLERWTWAILTNSSLGWQGTAASPSSMPSEWLGPHSPISQSHPLLPSHPFLGRSSTPSGNVTLLCHDSLGCVGPGVLC